MNPEKPYIIFAGGAYYPAGGWEDRLDEEYATAEEARNRAGKYLRLRWFDWAQIVDLRSRKMVLEGSRNLNGTAKWKEPK